MKNQRFAAIAAVFLVVVLTGCSGLGSQVSGASRSSGGGSAPSASNSSASGSSGSGSSGSGGSSHAVSGDGSRTKVDCSAFSSAVTAMFPQGVSTPITQGNGTCVWGVGSNAKADASTLGQSLHDIFSVNFSYGDDARTQYEGDSGAISGGAANLTKIPGVGSAAAYYDGGTGVPQVAAWSGKVACGTHLFISDAAIVGLAATGDGTHPIAASDTPGLAKKIAEVCAIGWQG